MGALFILFISINILAFIIGRLLTLDTSKWPVWLNMKPFNCRKCLTTHISWVLNTFIGLLIGNWIYIIAGIIVAGVIYYLIDIEEKKQWS